MNDLAQSTSLGDAGYILLVGDQPSELHSYEIMLGDLGERLIKAASAREAWLRLLDTEIDVVLIGGCTPEVGGFELARMIRAHPGVRQIPIIFVSAIQLPELASLRGYDAGPLDGVPAPVSPDVLRAKVKLFAELFRKTRALERLNTDLAAQVRERTAELEASDKALQSLASELEARIEERERALVQLFEAQKTDTIGQLTGGVAHDFNNLLMAILSSLRLLRKRMASDSRAQGLLDNAIQGAERGAALTQRLLSFARRQELRPQVVDLGQLIGGIEDLLRRALGPGITILNEIPDGLAPVNVDPDQLELALFNLAVNARDAMPSGGTLIISGGRRGLATEHGAPRLAPGAYVLISVTDTGAGMDEATLRRATEPFFTTKGVGKGAGLGLSMVDGLAAQSGGALQLNSRAGHGATVTLWLPEAIATAAAAPEHPAAAQPPIEALPGRTILLVDDDPLVCTGTAAMLEDLGHAVVEASSAGQALAIMDSGRRVDVIITDYAMPGMSGLELARRLMQTFPHLPVILASGYADFADGEAQAAFSRLTKPFAQEDLEAALFGALSARSQPSTMALPGP